MNFTIITYEIHHEGGRCFDIFFKSVFLQALHLHGVKKSLWTMKGIKVHEERRYFCIEDLFFNLHALHVLHGVKKKQLDHEVHEGS